MKTINCWCFIWSIIQCQTITQSIIHDEIVVVITHIIWNFASNFIRHMRTKNCIISITCLSTIYINLFVTAWNIRFYGYCLVTNYFQQESCICTTICIIWIYNAAIFIFYQIITRTNNTNLNISYTITFTCDSC